MAIERLPNTSNLPIGEHLDIQFQICPKEEFLHRIVNYLNANQFNAELSRVLVFVRSRRKAEEYTIAFNQGFNLSNAAFFHAGMGAEERKDNYEKYKKGEIVLLFATKAFGMGMNIPNIHYLFHIQPPSNFEDFLQEVGRAGRKKEAYEAVGFGENKKIKTICLYENDDFGRIKDLMFKSQIGWNDIKRVNEIIQEYYKKFRPFEIKKGQKQEALALPTNLLETSDLYRDNDNANTIFRITLYWLSKLKRYKVEYFVPSYLEFDHSFYDNGFNVNRIADKYQRELVKLIIDQTKDNFYTAQSTIININEIRERIGIKGNNAIYQTILKAQKNGYLKWLHHKRIKTTILRNDEIKNGIKARKNPYPTLNAMFQLVESILENIPQYQRKTFNQAEIQTKIKECLRFFSLSNYNWVGTEAKEEAIKIQKKAKKVEKEREAFEKKRAKHAMWLISNMPNVRQQTKIGDNIGEVVYIIYNNLNYEAWSGWLWRFKNSLNLFLKYLHQHISDQGTKINIGEAILNSGIDEQNIKYLDLVLSFLRRMGYIKMQGGLGAISLELYLKSTDSIDEKNNTLDQKCFSSFQKVAQLKELRLAALQTFASIKNKQKQEQFIKSYFSAKDASRVINLLEENLTEDNQHIIEAFRQEALKEAKEKLNQRQKEMYNAPLDQHLSVIAGPGSGKTHTLVLRIVRLIQEEKVNPEQILILAFNRAVVIELKERIRALFSKIGYRNLTKSLKVFTFHGIVKRCLQDEIEDVKLKDWVDIFCKRCEENKNFANSKLGTVQYIFVDEFQDINKERLRLIEHIANPKLTKLTVIGDPNQSIYGFDREKDGHIAPLFYYQAFNNIYKPDFLFLTVNYRSYRGIIEKAETILAYLKTPFLFNKKETIPKLEANKGDLSDVVEEYNLISQKTKWQDHLLKLIDANYEEIAIMLRTNEEIFRAFGKIKQLNIPKDFEIRIQGEGNDIFKSREFAFWTSELEKDGESQIPSDYLEKFVDRKQKIINNYPNFSCFIIHVLHSLYYEFAQIKEELSTYSDLLDFIKSCTRKDDGQLYQVYERNKNKLDFPNVKRIVLTTMHRVKGLEYQAVMVLPSFAKLPFQPKEQIKNEDYYDEEIRLRYVAFSRAKEKLMIFNWKREDAILGAELYVAPEIKALKYPVKTGIDKFVFSRVANEKIQEQLFLLKIGSPIILKKDRFENWDVFFKREYIGRLSKYNLIDRKELQNVNQSKLEGFFISGFIKYELKESLEYDEKNEKNYTSKWDDYCKNRGWILIPDFSGYGR